MKKLILTLVIVAAVFTINSCSKTHKELLSVDSSLDTYWDKIYLSSNGVPSTISASGEVWYIKHSEDSLIVYDHTLSEFGEYLFHRVTTDSVFYTNPAKPLFSMNFKYHISHDTLVAIGIRTNNSGDKSQDTSIFKKF